MTVCDSITPLIPHKILIIETLTADAETIPPFDVVMIDESEWNKNPAIFKSLAELPRYSMDDGKFYNLEGDFVFAQTLLKKVKKMKTENEIETYVRISILKMIKKAEQLEALLTKENKIDAEVILETLGIKNKYFETLLLLLGEKRRELQTKIDTKEKRLKRFLASK